MVYYTICRRCYTNIHIMHAFVCASVFSDLDRNCIFKHELTQLIVSMTIIVIFVVGSISILFFFVI